MEKGTGWNQTLYLYCIVLYCLFAGWQWRGGRGTIVDSSSKCVQIQGWGWNIRVRRCCWAAGVVSYLTLVFLSRNLSDPFLNTLAPSLSTWLEKCKVKQAEECEAFIFQSLGSSFSCWGSSLSTVWGKEDAKWACLTRACVTAEGYGAAPQLTKQIMLPLALTFPRSW